ncbi:MAG: hypothetical protein FD141_658 [Fusobacteria bacterium]|nr:MAG: hypothetical protein FD141_658 [Fusobacteriota bacterium]KAF0228676.1 MAG: hypothetical protein FD182_932 [Fusobacteriota bacterium]
MVIEGVVVFPMVMVLLFSFVSFINFFSVSSFIRQRVDSYGAYVCSVDGLLLDGVADDVVEVAASWGSRAFVRSYLLEGGFLDGDRLVVSSDFDGGYMTVRVEYGVDVVLLGRVVVVDFYERRLW